MGAALATTRQRRPEPRLARIPETGIFIAAMIRATAVYLFVALYVLVFGPLGLTWTALSGNARFSYCLARGCIRIALRLCGIRLHVHGRERIPAGRNCLFLSNNQGTLDGPILFYAAGRDVRALVKREMMRIPLLATVLRQVRFVPIDRRDPQQAHAAIDRAAELLRTGLSFIAFPEGTRSRDGSLGPFKKGVFVMAIRAQVPVVPVTIHYSRAVQPPGSYGIRPAVVEVLFHDPIPTEGMKQEDRDDLAQRTRTAIAASLTGPAADSRACAP